MPTLSLAQRIARQLRGAAKFLIPKVEGRHRRRMGNPRPPHATPPRRRHQVTSGLLPAVLLTLLGGHPLQAEPIYVDSRLGNDKFDGQAQTQVSDRGGPVRSLGRAMRLVRPGDTVVLANNGDPYVGGMSLYGLQQSGIPGAPVQILGNGSVVTGARPIEPTSWTLVSSDVWRITPLRKGWYQLVLDGTAVPEVPCSTAATSLPDLAENSWCAFQGRVYYRPPTGQEAPRMSLALADDTTGMSLVAVEYLVIRDLTLRHFRQDGVHLFDRCREITLENVICEGNGRAGIVVGGTSQAQLVNVTCRDNRQQSLLVEELGAAEATDSTFDQEPTVNTLTSSGN